MGDVPPLGDFYLATPPSTSLFDEKENTALFRRPVLVFLPDSSTQRMTNDLCERPLLRRFPLVDNPNDSHVSLNHNNCWSAVVDGQPLESATFRLHLRRAQIKAGLEVANASYAPAPRTEDLL